MCCLRDPVLIHEHSCSIRHAHGSIVLCVFVSRLGILILISIVQFVETGSPFSLLQTLGAVRSLFSHH